MKPRRLLSLEENIAKFRAIEMILVLFRIERFRRSVLEAIRATDRIQPIGSAKVIRLPQDAKKVFDRALSILVCDGIFTTSDKVEIVKLVDYRNKIAHRVESLLHDLVSAYIDQGLRDSFQYRYDALSRIEHFQRKFDKAPVYIRVASIENFGVLFVEETFVAELRKLKSRIDTQWKKRYQQVTASGGKPSSAT